MSLALPPRGKSCSYLGTAHTHITFPTQQMHILQPHRTSLAHTPALSTWYAMQEQAHNSKSTAFARDETSSAEHAKIRLLILEDHLSVVEALVHRLDRCSSVTIAHNMAEFQQAISAQHYDLAIVDLVFSRELLGLQMMPILQGAQIPFIVYSGNAELWHIRQAVNYGAQGFVDKRASLTEMSLAFDTVLAGGHSFPAEFGEALTAQCDLRLHKALTKREIRLMDAMFALAQVGSDNAPSNQELAEALHLSIRTVGNIFNDLFSNFDFKQGRDAFFKEIKARGYFPGVISQTKPPKK